MTPKTYTEVCDNTGLTFTSDLSGCLVSSIPEALEATRHSSLQQVLAADLKSTVNLIYSTREKTQLILQHYNATKQVAKDTTKAVCIVPAMDIAKLQPELEGWTLVHTLRKGSFTVRKHWKDYPHKEVVGETDLLVYVDNAPRAAQEPEPSVPITYRLRSERLQMSFEAKVSGARALIGTDTFAEGPSYIHPTFVQQNRLHTRPCNAQILLADGHTEVMCEEECLTHIQLGSYNTKAWLMVLHLPEPYDILLGDEWLRSHGARLLYDKQMLEIITPKRRHSIKTIHAPKPVSYTRRSKDEPYLLNFSQVRRSANKGHQMVMCFVQKESRLSEAEAEPEVSHPDVSRRQKAQLQQLLDRYKGVFGAQLYTDAIPREDMPECIPIMENAKIPNRPLYRNSPIEQAEIERQVHAMLEQGLIEHSTSPYGAPVLLVKKPDGSFRFCIDYRALNAITVKNGHSLPRIDDLLDKIQGAKYFSSMDLLQGFYQLPLRESDRPKTAFKTAFGHYQFRVVSMGLSNAPSVFQRMMNHLFRKHLNKTVLIYLDDILIFSKTPEEHLQHIQEVLQIIEANGLSVKTSKCHFFQQELKFLGHIISKDGIRPDPEKVQAVKDWPKPKTQTDVRAFLGMLTYFKRFIKGFAKIAAPLMELTKDEHKRELKWDEKSCTPAFEKLKELLITAPLLTVPDFDKPFTLITDASLVGLGGVLLQEGRPCAFESKKFSSAECNYTTTEREMLATVHCLKKWAVYLRHNPLNVIETDHIPNVYFNTKPDLSPREVRWMDVLCTFPGEWKYKPGKSNVADPLSRMPTFYINTILRSATPKANSIPNTQIQPSQQLTLLQQIKEGYEADISFNKSAYVFDHGLYYKDDKIVIPNVPEVIAHILRECHDSTFAGHMGRDKTLDAVKRLFFWKGMGTAVTDYVAKCHVCQTIKPSKTSSQGLMHPIEVIQKPWHSISLDLITGLPDTSAGHNAILTVVDRCSKMVRLIPTDETLNAERFAQLMLDNIFTKFTFPLDIIHDRDPRFTGHFFRDVCKILSIHQSMTSAWHPQSDGQTERMNRTIEQCLRAFTAEQPHKEWDQMLSMAEFAMNNAKHSSLQQTPFFLVFNQDPITPLAMKLIQEDKIACARAFSFAKDRKQAFDQAMEHLIMARDRYKSYKDANLKDITLNEGDQVLLSTVNLNKHNFNRKLFPKFIGPFPVTKIINDVAYRLQLPSTMTIHNVFHVSLLKPYKAGSFVPPPLPVEIQGELEFEVEKIIAHREKKVGTKSKPIIKKEYFIKWTGYGPEHCTWEPESHLANAAECIRDYWKGKELEQAAVNNRPRQTVKRIASALPADSRKKAKQ